MRRASILVSSGKLQAWRTLTSDQAEILYALVLASRQQIIEKLSFGVWDGLCHALLDIHAAGGAYIRRELPSPEDDPAALPKP